MEQGMSLAYVRRLQGLYDDWIARYRLSDVLVLETDRLDYVNDLVHRLDVMRRIEQVLPRGFSDG
jgi:deoxyadenosine/deoxycytidine kinase